MRLKTLELNGFKSFAQKTILNFDAPIVCVVGPNGSGKSNVVEAVRFVLGEQSMKSLRGKLGTDLIFKGSKNLPKSSRASVVIHLDNRDRIFKLLNDTGESVNLDYATVTISREVYSDGVNKYILNGSEIRLKDINNLLASVNIGSSGHHIISQGEADRILNANPGDRREMIEDALGLKIYQYKIRESERKLGRTEANMKEVTMLRRENAPHLNFLKKQVEKFEKAREMQNELASLYHGYLKRENVHLTHEENRLKAEKSKFTKELNEISGKISDTENENGVDGNKKIEELRVTEKKLNEIHVSQNELGRQLGRNEGMLEVKENKVKLSGRCPLCGSAIQEMHEEQIEKRKNEEKELTELKKSHAELVLSIKNIDQEEKSLSVLVEKLKHEISQEMDKLRDKERERFALKVRHQELSSSLNLIYVAEEALRREKEIFLNEIKEGIALVGDKILSYKDFEFTGNIDRTLQDEERRKIERLKIKLEDMGGGNDTEIKKEFDAVSERDNFLAKELIDLEKSIESINQLMSELREKIDHDFKEGVKKINTEFQEFFSIMFGGGTASLKIVTENKKKKAVEDTEEDFIEEEKEPEEGIEINVSLPHKKVRELHALSGGERSLTSIALLFSMSQVNPPPFLVLDETDAALDEANSRKFGDMLEKLSKHSGLVVVTHNRETMSRAEVLYGVTVGSDGASKLLSVAFEEAVSIAK